MVEAHSKTHIEIEKNEKAESGDKKELVLLKQCTSKVTDGE